MSWTDIWNKLKSLVLYLITLILIFIVMFLCFEHGLENVQNWEKETGRYGEGLL